MFGRPQRPSSSGMWTTFITLAAATKEGKAQNLKGVGPLRSG